MKPVTQTKFGGEEGNCFAACVASVLELSIDDVPNFCGLYGPEWFIKFDEWLRSQGYGALMLNPDGGAPLHNCYYLIGGNGPRGFAHEVVGLNGKMVHDPHPSGDGLTDITDYIVFVKTFVSVTNS